MATPLQNATDVPFSKLLLMSSLRRPSLWF